MASIIEKLQAAVAQAAAEAEMLAGQKAEGQEGGEALDEDEDVDDEDEEAGDEDVEIEGAEGSAGEQVCVCVRACVCMLWGAGG